MENFGFVFDKKKKKIQKPTTELTSEELNVLLKKYQEGEEVFSKTDDGKIIKHERRTGVVDIGNGESEELNPDLEEWENEFNSKEANLRKIELSGKKEEEINKYGIKRLNVRKEIKKEDLETTTREDVEEFFDLPENIEFKNFRFRNLFNSLRLRKYNLKIQDTIKNQIRKIAYLNKYNKLSNGFEELNDQKNDLMYMEEELRKIEHLNPEAYYAFKLLQLKENIKNLEEGGLVLTGSIMKKKKELEDLSLEGAPVFIDGHLGSGKTEMALDFSKDLLKNRTDLIHVDENGKEIDNRTALIISGSKNIDESEFYGHQVLEVNKELSLEDIDSVYKETKEYIYKKFPSAYEEDGTILSEDEYNKHKDEIQERTAFLLNNKTKTSQVVTRFFKGPIYQAMVQGRPVILDEVNAIPHEILIGLNHILTRKPGDKINIQQDSGEEIEIKEGFMVIATGNLGEQYVGRQKLDPAFLDRFKKRMEYDYPKQTIDNGDSEGTRKELEDITENDDNELFEIMCSMIMRKEDLCLKTKKDVVGDIFELAKVARLIQDIFSDKIINKNYFRKEGGKSEGGIRPTLKENVLSFRGLKSIMDSYKNKIGAPMGYHVFKGYIANCKNIKERQEIYTLIKNHFNLFRNIEEKDLIWPEDVNLITNDFLGKLYDIEVVEEEFYSPREIVDMVYGKAPKRLEWPNRRKETIELDIEKYEELKNLFEEIKNKREIKDKDILYFVTHIELELEDIVKNGGDLNLIREEIELLSSIVDNNIDDFSELDEEVKEYLQENCSEAKTGASS